MMKPRWSLYRVTGDGRGSKFSALLTLSEKLWNIITSKLAKNVAGHVIQRYRKYDEQRVFSFRTNWVLVLARNFSRSCKRLDRSRWLSTPCTPSVVWNCRAYTGGSRWRGETFDPFGGHSEQRIKIYGQKKMSASTHRVTGRGRKWRQKRSKLSDTKKIVRPGDCSGGPAEVEKAIRVEMNKIHR